MIRRHPIQLYGAAVLEQPAATVGVFGTMELIDLLGDMFETMYASKGVGLAAPQIGISKRIAVIDVSRKDPPDPSQQLVLINPVVIHVDNAMDYSEEGCLSLPGFFSPVGRPSIVTIRAQNWQGEATEATGSGLLARAILHEIDHLDGKLFIEHCSPLRREIIQSKIRRRRRLGQWATA